MKVSLMLMLLASVLAQKELDIDLPEEPERIRVLAIQATQEGRREVSADPSLAPVREFLDTLPFDTFREIAFHELTIPYGEDRHAELNPEYIFHCRPVRLSDAGAVVLEVRIDMKQGDTVLEALRVSGRSERGQGMVFRGFPLSEGEMVVVMSVAKPTEDNGDGGDGDASQGEQDESSGGASDASADASGSSGSQNAEVTAEPETSNPEEDKDTEEEEQREALSLVPAENESTLPPELANLEGILRALEEVDRKEQAASRSRRVETQVRGAWW